VHQGSLLIVAGIIISLAFTGLAGYVVWRLSSLPTSNVRSIAAVLAAIAALLGVLPAILIALHG
jgi:hypothetical protein